ncbi:hypothetical protein VN12_19940 [Pirellula sp. SH-Sr6A]|uniref:hypothetical protein n=1 Tax=Pirellula sp. SH-Sr6A TaxID=1632865 RepID=UPI00078CB553|nr:hypothetical protein [Pirellula sp. SH-Sr6A]AMV34406.1 hypothetical protein VN12_19940 [Pirellula sp. SH-Sr6A]
MKYERSSDELLSVSGYVARLVRSVIAVLLIVAFSLGLGAMGYCYFGDLTWDDGLLNAAMILTGMGPVDRMHTTAGKLFATVYALYSGVAFLSMMALLIAPIFHRFLHRFHLEEE